MSSNVVVDLRVEMELLAHSVLLLLLLVRRTNSADSQRLLTEADLVRRKTERKMCGDSGEKRRDKKSEREGERDERERLHKED
jgi:hypothetical protein